MKKIGVISDTHIPVYAKELPRRVIELFEGADLILHAGDSVEEIALDELNAIAPTHAVCGNMDRLRNHSLLPDKRIITVESCRIGLIHGWGAPQGLEDRIFSAFQSERLDAIVYGHSHNAHQEIRDGVLLFNPGTPTDSRFASYRSVGILTVDGEIIKGEIIRI